MKINPKSFRVREGDEVDLRKWPTSIAPGYESKELYHELLEKHVAQLSSLQQLLYASDRYAILLIFQAMNAAGKGGVIKHVMSGEHRKRFLQRQALGKLLGMWFSPRIRRTRDSLYRGLYSTRSKDSKCPTRKRAQSVGRNCCRSASGSQSEI